MGLPIAVRCIHIDMRLDRLRNLVGLRVNDLFTKALWSALPVQITGFINPRLAVELFLELTICALKRANKGAFFRPAFPNNFILAIKFGGLCHLELPLNRSIG